MAYTDSIALATSATFRLRVQASIVAAALQIHGEVVPAGAEMAGRKRAALALAVLQNPSAVVERFVWPVAVNPTISTAGEATPDGDIDFVVASSWDDLAGVEPGDLQG